MFLSFIFEYLADFFTIQGWRSLWLLEDAFLLADNIFLSGIASLSIGTLIYLIVSILNKKINNYVSQKEIKTDLLTTNNENNNTTTIILESESEKNYLAKNSILKKVCLNLTFFIVFIGTVSIWRGIWTMQLELCYPIIYESVVLNQNLLNLIYFVVSILILWYFDLVSAMLSRSSCEDSYFEIKKNCIVRQNHFKVYFQSKKKVFLI
jgi:hypothetical protein